MRLLHTSDWHLGQHFFGKTREQEHRALIQWLAQQVREHGIDVVLLAGDVFDTGAPPSYARELYHQLHLDMHDAGACLVVLGGNHDSIAMLGESRALLARMGTHVVPGMAPSLADQLLVVPGRDGQPGAIVCAVPFIRQREAIVSQAGETSQQKQLSLQQAIQQHYQALFELALQKRVELGRALPIIATGHLATVDASRSDSVRDIYIGTLDAFPSSAFPAADYIALGHIHRPQMVGGQARIRYCGSPLPLSFDELGQGKQMLLVEFAGDNQPSITALPVPQFQPMQVLRGALDELQQQIGAVAQQLLPQQRVWLELVVSGKDSLLNDLPARVAAMVDVWPAVDVLRIRRERMQDGGSLQLPVRETLAELEPAEVFEQLLASKDREGALDEPLRQQLRTLHSQVLLDVKETAE